MYQSEQIQHTIQQIVRRPFSPLVLTPDELAHRLALRDPFYREILRRGKVLYVRN